jgi:hypothetical protein
MRARLSIRFAYCAALLLAPILALPTPSLAQPDVNGWNVTAVYVANGEYRLKRLKSSLDSSKHWIEEGRNGRTSDLVEYNRDDESVYLSDPSRGVRLQLDLYRNQVFYLDSNGSPPRRLYPITDASAEVNSQNVVLVETPQGRFRATEPGHWGEEQDNGSPYNFVELFHDESSITLEDQSRSVLDGKLRLQLDLRLMRIFHIWRGDAPKQPLYAITRVSAIGGRTEVARRGDCDATTYWETGGCSSRRFEAVNNASTERLGNGVDPWRHRILAQLAYDERRWREHERQERASWRFRFANYGAFRRPIPIWWRRQPAWCTWQENMNSAEGTICTGQERSAFDNQPAHVYQADWNYGAPDRIQEWEWVQMTRNRCGRDVSCLEDAYRTRTNNFRYSRGLSTPE